jgi:hypothetical protein
MPSIPSLHEQKCTRCGSKLVDPEWDERSGRAYSKAALGFLWLTPLAGDLQLS